MSRPVGIKGHSGKQVRPVRSLWHHLQGRSLPLMVSLFLLLLLYPVFESPANTLPSWLARWLFALVPITGALILEGRRWPRVFLFMLVGSLLVLDIIDNFDVAGSILFWVHASAAVSLYGYCAFLIVRSVFIRDDLKDHPVYGGITGYMLIGVTFAIVYTVIIEIDSGAFLIHSGGASSPGDIPFGDLLYYSFVCLSTLGLGDITPVNAFARSVSIVEAVIGVMYVAVLIAQLVIAPSQRRASNAITLLEKQVADRSDTAREDD